MPGRYDGWERQALEDLTTNPKIAALTEEFIADARRHNDKYWERLVARSVEFFEQGIDDEAVMYLALAEQINKLQLEENGMLGAMMANQIIKEAKARHEAR